MTLDERVKVRPVRYEIGRALRTFREARRLSQEKLALEAGVTQGSISNYETGRHDIPLSVLIAICEALGTRVADMLDFEPGRTGYDQPAAAHGAATD